MCRRRCAAATFLRERRLPLRQTLTVPFGRIQVTDSVADCVEHGPRDRVWQLCQPIVDPEPLFARGNESGAAQVGQVPRRGGLRQPEAFVDVAHADLAGGQEAENAEPGPVCERLEHRFEAIELLVLHEPIIFVLTDIVERSMVNTFA